MMALAVKYYKLFLNCGRVFYPSSYAYVSGPAGEWGTGSGKGGGSGGSIREAGGTFGKMEAAREEEYFRKLQSQQLSKLKKHMSDEISHYKRLIQQHKDAIDRLESHIREIKSQDAMKEDDSSTQG